MEWAPVEHNLKHVINLSIKHFIKELKYKTSRHGIIIIVFNSFISEAVRVMKKGCWSCCYWLWSSRFILTLHMRMYVTMRQVLQKAVIRCSPVPKHVRSEILALMRHYAGEITVNFIIGNYVKEMNMIRHL